MDNEDSNINRKTIPSLLLNKYKQQYYLALDQFPPNAKLELIEHLLVVNSIHDANFQNPDPELQKKHVEAENNFIRRHGKIAKTYVEQKMNYFYDNQYALVEKGIYPLEVWGNLEGEIQSLSPEEMQRFMALSRNFLYYDRQRLWLEQSPEYLTTDAPTPQNSLAGTALKAAEEAENKRRKALDKATVLSQEQSVLLLHYLKEIKVFLREHNLSNKDAGIAFGILTGYSHDTIRQKLGKLEPLLNYENLEFLYNYTVRLQKAIDIDLKKLEKPE